jgi:hypothetical protein
MPDLALARSGPDMRHASIADLLARKAASLSTGPLAIVMAEDEVEVDSTLTHLPPCPVPSTR